MTPTTPDNLLTRIAYDLAADRYQRSLPPEHYMEATTQATQRKITLAAFDQIAAARPDIQAFNELLLQYPRPDDPTRPAQVVPDNMVVVHPTPIRAEGSYNLPLQPVGPTLVLEYVSKSSTRKDYDDNMRRYQAIGVPYYLIFYPDNDELSVFRRGDAGYSSAVPDDGGQIDIPELELKVGLVGKWLRFWFRGRLLPLTAELVAEVAAERAARREAELELAAERDARRADTNAMQAEIARLKALLANGTPP
jgi:Uma2 family endonuclease